MSVAVVVPWRDKGDQHRRANMEQVRANLIEQVPDWRIIWSTDHRTGPFNRQAAYNNGAKRTDADILIWHEADIIADRDTLLRLAEAAREPGLHTVSTMHKLDESGAVAEVVTMKPQGIYGHVGGPLSACSRESLSAVGRWDESLSGHGWDDNAMNLAFRVACRVTPAPIEATITHLWHPRGVARYDKDFDASLHTPEELDASDANLARLRAYRKAKTPEDVRALTMEAA